MSYSNLKITEKCIKCGSCLGCGFEFLTSANDGSIIVKNGTMLETNSEEFKTLTDICPVNAFLLDKVTDITDKKQLIKNLLQELSKYEEINIPTVEELSFNKKEYIISLPSSLGERKYDYSSNSAAERAALNEFEGSMYSRLNNIILKIVTEYRVRHVKPYYTADIDEGSVYAENNKKISEILQAIVDLSDEKFEKDFVKIDVFPNKECDWKMLNKGELISDECISAIRKEFDYTSNDYSCYWDTDAKETSLDKKSIQKYCYKNLNKAYEKLAEDIINACYCARYRMEDTAIQSIKLLVNHYNKELKEVMDGKIKQIKKIVFPKYKTNFEHLELNHIENCGYEMNELSNIPLELSDYISSSPYYSESEDYIMWIDYNGQVSRKCDIAKKFFEYTDIKESEMFYTYKIFNKKHKSFIGWYDLNRNYKFDFKISGSKVVFSDFEGLYTKDIVSDKKELICATRLSPFMDFQVCDGKIAFFDWDNNFKVLDIKTKKLILTLNKKFESFMLESQIFQFCLYKEKLIYNGSNRCILSYDFGTKKTTTLYQYIVSKEEELYADTEPFMYVQKICAYKNFINVIYWDKAECERKLKILRINLTNNEKKFLDVCNESYTGFLNFHSNIDNHYILFRNKKVYMYNINTHNINSVEKIFPSDISKIHIIGNYAYWGYGTNPDYKMNLCDLENETKFNLRI